jgi:hypothetical protein
MAYYIDLFSPETYEAFRSSSRDVSGFRVRQKTLAARVSSGDIFVCYMTRLSRWFGVLEVIDGPYIDSKPIFTPADDPFVVRFRVRPIIVLDPERSIPIHDSEIWKRLSFTRNLEPGSAAWTGKVRGSLTHLDPVDCMGSQFADVSVVKRVGLMCSKPLCLDFRCHAPFEGNRYPVPVLSSTALIRAHKGIER